MRIAAEQAALLLLPAFTNAVSLSDLKPRASNLPAACEDIYTEQISGCRAEDFSTKDCSSSCIAALEALVQPIREACSNQGVSGENLIVAFLAGVGPKQICTNILQTPGHGTYTGGPPRGPWTSSTSASSLSSSVPSASTTVTVGTSTASSLGPNDSSSLVVDTSSTPTTRATTATPSATRTATSPSSSSSNNPQSNFGDHSGGGSPFDTAGNLGGAANLSLSATVVLLSASVAFLTTFR